MRLLSSTTDDDFTLRTFHDERRFPDYAILSHTWTEDQEVTYGELLAGTGKGKTGYDKLRLCKGKASEHGLEYFWVDTCCMYLYRATIENLAFLRVEPQIYEEVDTEHQAGRFKVSDLPVVFG